MSFRMMSLLGFALGLAAMASPGDESVRPHKDCEGCHIGHSSAKETPLLVTGDMEALCGRCHDGTSGLPKETAGGVVTPHLLAPPETFESRHTGMAAPGGGRRKSRGKSSRSAGCAGCHEPHASAWGAEGPTKTLSRKIFSPDGERLGTRPENTAQVCFACHASARRGASLGNRSIVGPLFSARARSTHRIGSTGRLDLPSLRFTALRAPLDCVSCHDSQGDSGMRGPHVSRYPHLLAARNETGDGIPEDGESYALCYGCHDRLSILGDESFPFHKAHITGSFAWNSILNPPKSPLENLKAQALAAAGRRSPSSRRPTPRGIRTGIAAPTSCFTCHDPHGSLDNPSLIRFDRMVVSPNRFGRMEFRSVGRGNGSCSLECHGHEHDDARY